MKFTLSITKLRDACYGIQKYSANSGSKKSRRNNNNKADNRTATIYRVMVPKDRKMLVMTMQQGEFYFRDMLLKVMSLLKFQ